MILVDTSVWVDHLRKNDRDLAVLLDGGMVLTHPFVIGEIALGSLRQRQTVVDALLQLPQIKVANDDEVRGFIERQALFGVGIGYVDAHLLAAIKLTPGASLWTRDRKLNAAAVKMGLGRSPVGRKSTPS